MRMLVYVLPAMLGCLMWAALGGTEAAKLGQPPEVLTGNMSVGYLQWVLKGRLGDAPPPDYASSEALAGLKAAGVRSIEDYICFLAASPQPHKLDFSYYRRNAEILKAAGMQYTVYPWLHFVPKWFEDSGGFVPYKCLAHDKATFSTSVWAPQTLKLWDWFYDELKRQLGDEISAIYLGMPADYGEVGMPVGMANWLVPERHFHKGFWCNDAYARKAFSRFLEEKYKNPNALNKAYESSFRTFGEVGYPASPAEGRVRWLDFLDFYFKGEMDFLAKSTHVVRKYFPKTPLQIKLGYGGEYVQYGVDNGAACKEAAKLGITVRSTHGKLPYYFAKRISTPARFYGADYLTEPPSNVNRQEEVWRLFCDASCEARRYFDYPGNILKAADLFKAYGFLLDGDPSIVKIALAFDTTSHRLKPNESDPPALLKVANELREFADYDVVDEQLILDGALQPYSVLIWPEGKIVPRPVQEALAAWVESGGILLKTSQPFESVDGPDDYWARLQSTIPYELALGSTQVPVLRCGKGRIILLPMQMPLIKALFASLSAGQVPKVQASLGLVDNKADKVLMTLFADKVLVYYFGDAPLDKTFEWDAAQLKSAGVKHLASSKLPAHLTLRPHSLTVIQLKDGTIYSGPGAGEGGI